MRTLEDIPNDWYTYIGICYTFDPNKMLIELFKKRKLEKLKDHTFKIYRSEGELLACFILSQDETKTKLILSPDEETHEATFSLLRKLLTFFPHEQLNSVEVINFF